MKAIKNNNRTYRTFQSAGAILPRLAVTVVLIALMIMATTPAFAAGSVDYQGESKGFVLEPGGTDSKTDIFPSFKDAMPGDTITDTITVKNSGSKETKIYMRALDPEKNGADLLSQLKLKVDEKSSGKIFEAAADKKTGLEDWVLLGTFSSGGSTTLDLTLEVPIELDNTYQDSFGYVNWQFMAEDITEDDPIDPDDPDDPSDDSDDPSDDPSDDSDDPTDDPDDNSDDPSEDPDDSTGGSTKTNDPTTFVPWIIALVAAVVVLAVLFIKRRK